MSDTPCCAKPSGRGRRPDPRKRAAIIEAAAALFVSHGYGITMDAIAAQAGVSKQTIYNAFSTKEDLFAAVITDRVETVLGGLSRPPADARPEDVLRQVAGQFLRFIAGGASVCVQRMIIMSGSDTDHALAHRFYDSGPRRAVGLLAAYLRQETAAGRLRVTEPELAAEGFFGMLNGHIHMRSLLGLQNHWDDETLTRKVDYCVAVFLKTHGVTAA